MLLINVRKEGILSEIEEENIKSKFVLLNETIENINNSSIFTGNGEYIIIPDSFEVVEQTRHYTIIGRNNQKELSIRYYPMIDGHINTLCSFGASPALIVPEKEYLFEKLCLLTELQKGEENPNILYQAINNLISGSFADFSDIDSREYIEEKIKSSDVTDIMDSTLKRINFKKYNRRKNKQTEKEYVDYIKDIVNAYKLMRADNQEFKYYINLKK